MTGDKCVVCGEPAVTELMIYAGGGRDGFAKPGKICGRCQRDVAANLAHEAKTGAPFAPIETGAQFPDGAHVTAGKCAQCAREGKITRYLVEVPQVGRSGVKPACAECIADLAAGVIKFGGGASIYVQQAGGEGRFGKLGVHNG